MKTLPLLTVLAAFAAAPVSAAWADADLVGKVDKVQGDATATQLHHDKRALAQASDVLFQDRLATGAGARLQATLADGTQLTLGEKGRLTVDDFVYKPGADGNKLDIKVKGAFLFVGGKVEGPTGGNVTIHTPVGTLGVRGTTVWGGYIDGGYGVVVLDGEVFVKTKHGEVDLKKGQGTMVYGVKAPQGAAPWPDKRMKAAVQTITFAP